MVKKSAYQDLLQYGFKAKNHFIVLENVSHATIQETVFSLCALEQLDQAFVTLKLSWPRGWQFVVVRRFLAMKSFILRGTRKLFICGNWPIVLDASLSKMCMGNITAPRKATLLYFSVSHLYLPFNDFEEYELIAEYGILITCVKNF